jgi:signal transduction histidine kinase
MKGKTSINLPIQTSKMSIKVKLTLWFTLVSFLLVVIVQGFMLILDGGAVMDDAGALLVSVVQENLKRVDERDGKTDVNDIAAFRNGVYTSVYDESGKFLSGAVPFETDEPFSRGATRTVTVSGKEFLLYDVYVQLSSGGVWVRGVTPAETADTLLQTVLSLSAFTLPLALVLGAAGGYLVAGRALKPIRQITEAANAINDGNDLSRRIGLGKPGSHDELQKLSDTFDNMFERLEKSFDSQQQFTSDVSHELRTPITVILAECDYTRKHAKTTENYGTALEVVSRQAKKMSRLVESLLSLSRLDLGTAKTNFEEEDLSELINVICEETRLVGSKGITMQTDIEEGICANIDVTLMSRLVQNLIDNAYKYGREGGGIEVTLRGEKRFAVIKVADDGMGIAKEQLEKIWQRFYQGDSSRSGGEGLGLGLAMVKQIAELHGGSVSAESEPGRGSTFTVKIPRTQA